MCLLLFAYRSRPDYELVLAANRDELFGRPTAPAGFWKDHPDLLGGRDLEHMGTWLGITRAGRFAALTNFRGREAERRVAPSRGDIVRDFLTGSDGVSAYIARIERSDGAFNGYNLLLGADGVSGYHSNRGGHSGALAPGLYGLSNHLLDTPWPKVERGKRGLREIVDAPGAPDVEALFHLLSDSNPAPDALLPDTGVGMELERTLSPIFIRGERYGTRCSTVLLISAEGEVRFEERDLARGSAHRFAFTVERGA